ncbi:MAG: hypothetical protein ABII64_02505 [Elusimicrobiota bacterium]
MKKIVMTIVGLCLTVLCAVQAVYARNIPSFSRYSAVTSRNLFYPIWRSSQKTPEELEAERKTEFERIKNEQENKLGELRKQEEQRKIETKKKQIESSLQLTGVVFDGNKVVAFVQNKREGGKTLILKQGDKVEECVVESVNELQNEVVLDYQGSFKITLSLKKGINEQSDYPK